MPIRNETFLCNIHQEASIALEEEGIARKGGGL